MRALILLSTFFILGCHRKEAKPIFNHLINDTVVEIHLADYHLDSVPREIGTLKNAISLYISTDSVTRWIAYPPLGARGESSIPPPFKHLPNQITELTNLRNLTLIGLNLVTLPDNFGQLKGLDTLLLYMNKLTVSNELKKLADLKHLKYIGLQGNILTTNDLMELEKSIPGITTNPGLR